MKCWIAQVNINNGKEQLVIPTDNSGIVIDKLPTVLTLVNKRIDESNNLLHFHANMTDIGSQYKRLKNKFVEGKRKADCYLFETSTRTCLSIRLHTMTRTTNSPISVLTIAQGKRFSVTVIFNLNKYASNKYDYLYFLNLFNWKKSFYFNFTL